MLDHTFPWSSMGNSMEMYGPAWGILLKCMGNVWSSMGNIMEMYGPAWEML